MVSNLFGLGTSNDQRTNIGTVRNENAEKVSVGKQNVYNGNVEMRQIIYNDHKLFVPLEAENDDNNFHAGN